MIVGIPKEIKNNENRVAMTPSGVAAMVASGHKVYVQSTAGDGSAFSDEEYKNSGAVLLPTLEEIYKIADMIVKVKEPIAIEYPLIRKNQLIFTYFHFASNRILTDAMIKQEGICLAYETVRMDDDTLPLLIPMSEVAGRMAVQEGAHYLEESEGGKGILLGGVTGVKPAQVLILGGGIVGTNAAQMAAGLGANVTIADINMNRLCYLSYVLPKNVHTLYSSVGNITKMLPYVDLIIGSVLVRGDKTPYLISRKMLNQMQPGTVLVDVAIDQGGCFETSKPTTHSNPIYFVDGILHYAVANIPGAVPRTSTLALTNVTLPYALQLANKGWEKACKENQSLFQGLNIVNGNIVFKPIADLFNLKYKKLVL